MDIKDKTMPNRVYDQLKKEIVEMELKPGKIISEIETSKRFDVSRTPVRDAFRRLESEKLIEVKPHIGTFVAQIDLEAVTDIIYLREKVEVATVVNMAGFTEDFKIDELRQNLALQKELLEKKEMDDEEKAREFIFLDNEFHRLIFAIAGKAGVWKMLTEMQNNYLRLRAFVDLDAKERYNTLYQTHAQILDYIENSTEVNIGELYRHHLNDGINNATSKIFEYSNYFKDISLI